MLRPLALTVLLTLALAAPAGAATLRTTADGFRVDGHGREVNHLTIERGAERTRVRDETTPLHLEDAFRTCVAVSANEVDCVNARSLEVHLGDGDDRLGVSGPGPGIVASGGAGADRVDGTDGEDLLIGGTGADELHGLGGADVLADAGAHERDRYDGGPGADVVDYSDPSNWRMGGLAIDLAAGTATNGFSEVDLLESIEGAEGTGANDVIDGTAGADVLDGGGGDDLLRGHGGDDVLQDRLSGNDRLEGAEGSDRLDAGPGDDALDGGPGADTLGGGFGLDTLLGRDGADRLDGGPLADRVDGGAGDDVLHTELDFVRDAVECGAGADAAVVDIGEDAGAGCETLRRVLPQPVIASHSRIPWRVSGRRLTIHGACAPSAGLSGGGVVLYIGGREVARGRWSCLGARKDPEAAVPIDLMLRPWVARRLRRGPVRAVALYDLGLAAQLDTKRRMTLRRARPNGPA